VPSRRALLAAPLFLPAIARAQGAWPSRAVRFIVAFPPGGGSDVLMRLLQPRIAEAIGQPVVIDNRPGAGTLIGTDAAAKAPADGYTFLNVANSFTINATLARNPPFDARKDFQAVASIGFNPHVLVAFPGLPAKDLPAIVAAAKDAPGRLSYASIGNGTSQHLGAESLKLAAGIDLQHVPYRGGAPALADVMAGTVALAFSNLPEALPLIREGRLRPIALSDSARSPVLPDVPTFEELGLPGVVSNTWFGVVARSEVPTPIVERMHGAITALLAEPDSIARLAQLGVEPRPMTRDAFGAMLAREFERNGRIAREAGITTD
jgi:tripartite-type tricarboxylate transporter receptor subunit TctC